MSSSKEVSTLIKQGFIPDHFHHQDPSFSPSRSIPSPLLSSPRSLLCPPPHVPASSSPTANGNGAGARPTLYEMMSLEQQHQANLHTQRARILRVLSTAPFRNSFLNNGFKCDGKDGSSGGVNGGVDLGLLDSGDVRLTVVSRDGFRVSMDVHRRVLAEKSRYFAAKLGDETGGFSGPGAVEVEISECDDVEVYVEVVVMMYTDDLRRKLIGEGVTQVLGLLKVSSAVSYDEGVAACLDYLEAVPWSNDEEEKVISQLRQLHLHNLAEEILIRVSAETSTSTRADEVFLRLLTGVLQAKDDKARREMKLLISRLLKEDKTNHGNRLDVSRDTLYLLCHRCLSLLVLSLSEATGVDDGKRDRDRGSLMAEITRAADNMHWVVEILIQKNAGEDFVKLWSDQKELAILHSKIPTVYRHEISRITAQLCIAIGRGQVLVPKDIRLSLLSTWLEALYEDYSWMRRASSKTLDKKLIEDGLGQTILTLPLAQQQAIMLNWFDRFLNKGDDCPNIQRAFEIWWRRAFARFDAGEPTDSQRQNNFESIP
ncbi:hypothetical protein MLD38_017314 [Melastoma candidum]|uniref:Uncharacterized protein n=1 Tax=Melastoma candidum TaxID=119954 RepID=A0ACB9QQA8_9MYRT|nr:hypothetical protein MLD38_017314 [Melastoma candidum]